MDKVVRCANTRIAVSLRRDLDRFMREFPHESWHAMVFAGRQGSSPASLYLSGTQAAVERMVAFATAISPGASKRLGKIGRRYGLA